MSNKQAHNKEVRSSAEFRANEMRTWPSPLEERMIAFLDRHYIQYEFQKIFYITADDGWITRYYIADFYIPSQKIIIEVDGKFHDDQKQKDKYRTREIQENYPGIEVLRFTWKDVHDIDVMANLVDTLRGYAPL